MNDKIKKLWPELDWIKDQSLREKTAKTWEIALERSVLSAEDLEKIPFTLLCGPDMKVTFMAHKRCVVHIAKESGEKIKQFLGSELPVNMDVLISGLFWPMLANCLNMNSIMKARLARENTGSTFVIPFLVYHLLKSVAYLLKCVI